jgi:hypothetical protein
VETKELPAGSHFSSPEREARGLQNAGRDKLLNRKTNHFKNSIAQCAPFDHLVHGNNDGLFLTLTDSDKFGVASFLAVLQRLPRRYDGREVT